MNLLKFVADQWASYGPQEIDVHTIHDTVYQKLPTARTLQVETIDELTSSHEEADTRLCLHACPAAKTHLQVIIVTPDTDVPVIPLGVATRFNNQLLMLTG